MFKEQGRTLLNRITLRYWDEWCSICKEHGIDAEKGWLKQRNYLEVEVMKERDL